MKCSCQAEIPTSARFCPHCGKRAEVATIRVVVPPNPEHLTEPVIREDKSNTKISARLKTIKLTITEPLPTPPKKAAFFWVALAIAGAGILIYGFAALMTIKYGAVTKDFGWQAVQEGDGWHINEVDANGPAAGHLQPGDRLIAINDDERASRVWPQYKQHAIAPGSNYTIRIARGSTEQAFELNAPLARDYKKLARILSLLPVSIGFFVVGVLVGLLKPTEAIARLAMITALAFALNTLKLILETSFGFFQGVELVGYIFIGFFSPLHRVLGYHFYYRFPAGVPKRRFWSLLLYLFYVCAVILFVAFRCMDIAVLRGDDAAISFFFNNYALLNHAFTLYDVFANVAQIATITIICLNFRLVKQADQRRRIKWIIYGSVVAVIPVLLSDMVKLILSSTGYKAAVASSTFVVTDQLQNMLGIVIPLAFGYAILKHRVFNINVVIRRGLQYLFAKNVLRLILSLPIIGLAYALLSNPNHTVADIFFHNPFYFGLIAAVALSLKFRRQLRVWIDRKFFRAVYDQEQLLVALAETIKDLNSVADISRRVTEEINAALHPQGVYIFYEEEERRDLTLGHASGSNLENLRIPETSQLLRFMENQATAQEFPFSRDHEIPQHEKDWLEDLGVNLIVPMLSIDQHLIGLLLLGEKKSEEPYSANDYRLLQRVAREIAIVYENSWLKARVDKEQRIKRDVLARFEEQKINLIKECRYCGKCFDSAALVCDEDRNELVLSLPIERIIDGKYRLERLLGKGGMGAVYTATDLRLQRQVAVKIVIESILGDSLAMRRFEREARASAKLNHPNIIAVYDYGRAGSEGAYLVMEMVYGLTLRQMIERRGKIEPQVAAEWFDQILEGVKAAHQAGVIHRDLKPDNVLISKNEDGTNLIKVLDFGLAKTRQPDTSDSKSLTVPGTIMGTFGYMSPEQLVGESVDERTDIFALGAMVVEVLTGKLPFQGKTYGELIMSVLHQPFHLKGDSREVRRLDEILQKCLTRHTELRYASVAELQKNLIPAIRDCLPFSATEPAPVDARR